MISKLKIIEYRKLKNILINFSKNINVISGTNGTCKSSLLYLISNSFQKPTGKLLKTEKNVISIINDINKKMNPKTPDSLYPFMFVFSSFLIFFNKPRVTTLWCHVKGAK